MTTNGKNGKWSTDCAKKRDDRERNMKIYVLKHFCGFDAVLIADLFDLTPSRVYQILAGKGSDLPAAPVA